MRVLSENSTNGGYQTVEEGVMENNPASYSSAMGKCGVKKGENQPTQGVLQLESTTKVSYYGLLVTGGWYSPTP